ncbi:unnamed protein product [Vicia faba]|uniref:ADP-ribosyl cyclase/cyclic ADP-ribose hydrolase n=1 Tax=Vicia faba TaxID=3906 RepID=A0AAV0ZGM7_VICFA|nr:unnamed protein product [Vicia faba]
MEDYSQNSKWKYHVFLSFRGEDTRLGFTDHLYAALVRKSIITFRDDEELARGEVISQKLLHAIEESLSAVVIISKNYANSAWCLDELVKILESKRLSGQQVFPIFYGVDPSDVRNQRGSFDEAFRKHEEKFSESKEKVQKWRDALREVANLSGWDSKDQHETKLIEEVVAQVWKKLELKFPSYNDGLVAIDARLKELYSTLKIGSEDVRFIGIWGMGGIGKTTLTTALYKKIKSQFDVSCFIANVREVSGERNDGMLQLQNKILSHLNIKGMVIETLSQGKDSLRNLLSNKKVLIVLDDVSSKSQLENLAGSQEWFGRESRIIVTTRDKHLLISHAVLFEMYESKILNKSESLQLFCEKAFKKDKPEEDYLELSKSVVEYAGGLPLALEVLGSFLCGRRISDWEDALIKIKQVPHDDILNKLRISYDMLEDEHKTLFLDIACFFKGWYKHKVIQILENCGFHPTLGINVLIEKSLVTFDGRVIGMHDMLEEMGKTIVFLESSNDPGKRSRLWSLEDIDEVLRNNKGTELVQGIVLKSSPSTSFEARWNPEAFSRMSNLRLLIILCDLHLSLGLKCLSSSLKVLIWRGYPMNTLPLGVQLDKLVHLQMVNSKVKQLWNGTQYFRKLRVIDLSNSKNLRQTPNVSGVPYLEELHLNDCTDLVEVHQSVKEHKKLEILSLVGCTNLKTFSSTLEMDSLKMLILSDCSNISRLPEFGKNMISMSVLNLMHCKSIVCLPNSISNLKSLKILNISGCSKICNLPDGIRQNKALENIDLSRTAIGEMDPSLLQLGNLKILSLSGCGLPASDSGGDVSRPNKNRLSYCNLIDDSIPDDIDGLSSLERLILSGNDFLRLPTCYFVNLSKLRYLELEDCPLLHPIPLLPPHACLYSTDSDARESKILDPQKIWKLFESSNKELFLSPVSLIVDYPYPVYTEIPSRFDNHNFFPLSSSYVSEADSIASITVKIPTDCRSSNGWAVAVFVALEEIDESFQAKEKLLDNTKQDLGGNQCIGYLILLIVVISLLICVWFRIPIKTTTKHMRMRWNFDTLEPEDGSSLSLFSSSTANNKLYLFTMVGSGDFIYIRRHTRGERKSMHKSFSKHRKPELRENSLLHFEVQVEGCKIRKCGWRVLHKEDYLEDLKEVNNGELSMAPSEHVSGMCKSTVDKLKGENATAFDVQKIEKSNESFSLGKMFQNIRQGLCLSMLILMSMMVAATVFPLPVQGFGFKKHTTTNVVQNKPFKSHWVSRKTVLKVNSSPRLNVSQRLSFPLYQLPRRTNFSQTHFCSYLTR